MRKPYTISAIGVLLVLAVNSPAQAELCYKQNYGSPVFSEERLCRFNQIFDIWLGEHGFEGDPHLSTRQRVGFIGSSWIDSWVEEVPHVVKPKAMIEIVYYLPQSESFPALDLIAFQPGYFRPLENVIRLSAKKIICATPDGGEQEFLRAGGSLVYEVTLRPSAMRAMAPDYLARIQIPQISCEDK